MRTMAAFPVVLGLVLSACTGGGDGSDSPTAVVTQAATPSATQTQPPPATTGRASTATSEPTPATTSTSTEAPTIDPPPGGRAFIAVTPNQGINTSTYGGGAFVIRSGSDNGVRIERVEFDLRTALLPDLVFDPFGSGGDPVGKPFTIDSGGGETGYVEDQLSTPLDGGFQGLIVSFSDFDPGDQFSFSIDIDPTSIKGAAPPGPDESGSVSGLELSGSRVVVTFSDGQTLTGSLFAAPDDDGGAVAVISASTMDPPTVTIAGISTPTEVSDAGQVIVVSGPPGAAFDILVVEAGLFLDGVPGGGFDIDPFESNSVIRVEVHSGTIGPSGATEVPVTLSASGPEGGYNHIIAVLRDSDGDAGRASEVLTVVYRP